MSKAAQWRNTPEGASGSSITTTRLWVPFGSPDHVSGGEISAPSQVYCGGISPPSGIAGLASIRGIVGSTLPARRSIDKKNALRSGETDAALRRDIGAWRSKGREDPALRRISRESRRSPAGPRHRWVRPDRGTQGQS